MYFNVFVEYMILISLFIATIGTGYIFIVTIFLKDKTYIKFYNNWQFPMLMSILADCVFVSKS